MKKLFCLGVILLVSFAAFSFVHDIPNTKVLPDGKIEFIDSLGESISSMKYDFVIPSDTPRYHLVNIGGELSDSLCAVGGKWGYVDSLGRQITPVEYDVARNYEFGVAIVCIDDKWGCIGIDGNKITELEFDRIGRFVNNMVLISKDGMYGYINTKGEYVIPIDLEISVDKTVPENLWNY